MSKLTELTDVQLQDRLDTLTNRLQDLVSQRDALAATGQPTDSISDDIAEIVTQLDGLLAHAQQLLEGVGMNTYYVLDAGETYPLDARTLEAAIEEAEAQVKGVYEPRHETYWVDIAVVKNKERVHECAVAIQPEEPDCLRGQRGHVWVLTKVYGAERGGETTCSKCTKCGCKQYLQAWGTRHDTGEHVENILSYAEGDTK